MRLDTRRRQRKTWVYMLVRDGFCAFVRAFGGLRFSGREYLPRHGAAVVLANHESFMDPPLIASLTGARPLCFMAKQELHHGRFWGWVFRMLLTVPVHRGSADLAAFRACAQLLAAGNVVGLFPEGSRSTDGTLRPAQPGAISIALKAGVPIIPVAIVGTFEMLPPGGRLRRSPVLIAAGPPLHYPELAGRPDKATIVRVGGEVMDAIARLRERLKREREAILNA